MQQRNRQVEVEVVALLNARAELLDALAPMLAAELRRYASKIAAPASIDEGLVEFSRFAEHHQGLADVLVPGQNPAEWAAFVQAARRLLRRALRERSLDTSLVGRLYALVSKLRVAP